LGIIPTLLEKIERTHERNLSEDDVAALLFRPNGLVPRVPLRSLLLIPYHLIRSRISRLWGE
jgi:hypothetical protein